MAGAGIKVVAGWGSCPGLRNGAAICKGHDSKANMRFLISLFLVETTAITLSGKKRVIE